VPVVFTVATAVLLLLQVPPGVPVLLSVIVLPAHTLLLPLIVPALSEAPIDIVMVVVAVPQLLLTVYLIVSMPGLIAVITPLMLIMAMVVFVRLHTPPLTLLVYGCIIPAHNVELPLIVPAVGIAVTLTVLVAAMVPQLLLTV
jgi:hypothetical protein